MQNQGWVIITQNRIFKKYTNCSRDEKPSFTSHNLSCEALYESQNFFLVWSSKEASLKGVKNWF